MKKIFWITLPLIVAFALPGCATSYRKITPRPAPTTQPVKQSVAKARVQIVEAVQSSAKARASIGDAGAIAAALTGKLPAQETAVARLRAALSQAGRDAMLSEEKATAAIASLDDASSKADNLQFRIDGLNNLYNAAQQTVADQQDRIAAVEKHDASTAASNRRLIFKIMGYRLLAALLAAWIASRFVPMLFPQFKLYAGLGAGVATLGVLCWLF